MSLLSIMALFLQNVSAPGSERHSSACISDGQTERMDIRTCIHTDEQSYLLIVEIASRLKTDTTGALDRGCEAAGPDRHGVRQEALEGRQGANCRHTTSRYSSFSGFKSSTAIFCTLLLCTALLYVQHVDIKYSTSIGTAHRYNTSIHST